MISENELRDELSIATQKETSSCIIIINNLKKFLPPKEKYHIIAFQVHFCIFANDMLRYTNYVEFTRSSSPVTSMASINAFNLTAFTLYQMLTQELEENTASQQNTELSNVKTPPKLTLFGYDDKPIYSIEESRQNKDATFNSFFSLSAIRKRCESHGLRFSHRIVCVPGLKILRIMGEKLKKIQCMEEPLKLTQEQRVLRNHPAIKEARNSYDDLRSESIVLQSDIKKLEVDLKNTFKLHTASESSWMIKQLKKQWSTGDKEQLHHDIESYKKAKNEYYVTVNGLRKRLAECRQHLYSKQMAIRYKDKLEKAEIPLLPAEKKIELDGKGVTKANTRVLDDPDAFIYTGTDNGVAKLSNSVPLCTSRFKFHLKLFNYYSCLKSDEKVQFNDEDDKFLNLPPVTTVESL